MKKLLLFAVAAGLVTSVVQGQNRFSSAYSVNPVKLDHRKALITKTNDDLPLKPSAVVRNTPVSPSMHSFSKSSSMVTGKVNIATSSNIYGTLLSEQSLMSYNNDLNVLGYTNRKPIGTFPSGNSGYICTHTSYDNGATWDTTINLMNNNVLVNRYPSGCIFNPPGNTTPNQAYSVAAAPLLDGTTWDGASFASIRLDTANRSLLNIQNASATVFQNMPRLGMFAGTNGNAYNLGSNYDFNATAPYMDGFVINRGVWSAANTSFTWDHTNIYHAFSHDAAGSQNFSTLGNIAFSSDGMIGYMATLGRDSLSDPLSYQPIIYRTTDAGATWSLYTAMDFTPVFDTIFPLNPAGFVRPFFSARNGFDLSVDAYGKLHILSEVANSYSNHPDSLDYGYFAGFLFDTWEQSNGVWNSLFIGQVMTDPAQAANQTPPNPNPNQLGWEVDWDGRAQICRSPDGYKMGYVWMDTDTNLSTFNEYPDLIGSAADFQSNTYTNPINYTFGTLYEANNYWLSIAYSGRIDGTTQNFVIPSTTASPLAPGGIDVDPWMHSYVSGIEFTANDFVNPITLGLNEVPVAENITDIFPNPARDMAILSVNNRNAQAVTVNIVNTIGQTVKSMDLGIVSGLHTYQVELKGLNSGLYNVIIISGNKVESKKLLIQK